MGGGYYDRDVSAPSSSSRSSHSTKAATVMSQSRPTSEMAPVNRGRIVCTHKHPITIAFDHTGSMGEDALIAYDKFPMFWGELKKKNYLSDPSVSFFAVGDVRSDSYPLQLAPFDEGINLDSWLKKLYLEGNGGGQGSESYETMAWYYANCCELQGAEIPFMFIFGDENYCPTVKASVIRQYCDKNYHGSDVDAIEVFKALKQKFVNVFLLHRTYDCGYGGEDAGIVKDWKKALGPEHVYILKDPKAIIDMMLGIIAVLSEARSLDDYAVDMKARGQTNQRVELITSSLAGLDKSLVTVVDKLPASLATTKRTTGSRRI
jgi:hypothetical protein